MKKDYLKPEVVEMGISCEVIMQATSQIPVVPGGDGSEPDLAGGKRGEWGNVWGK